MKYLSMLCAVMIVGGVATPSMALDDEAQKWIANTRSLIPEKERNIAAIEIWRDEACGRTSGNETRQCKLTFEHILVRRKLEKVLLESLASLKELQGVAYDHEMHILLNDKYNELNNASNQIWIQIKRYFRVADPNAIDEKVKQKFSEKNASNPREVKREVGVETENVEFTALSGQKWNHFAASLNPDCTTTSEITVRLEKPPLNGKFEAVRGEGYTKFKDDVPQHACNSKKVAGYTLFYQSNPNFVGEDQFSYVITQLADGQIRRVVVKVHVIGSQTKAEVKPTAQDYINAKPIDPVAIAPDPKLAEIPFLAPPVYVEPTVEVKLPPNGIMHSRKDRSAQAPFKVDNNSVEHYIIKLVNNDTKKKEITFFVRGGSNVEGKVPFGKYRILGVHGTRWLGEKDYFGDESAFFKVVRKDEGEIINFYGENRKNGQRVAHGGTLSLKVVDGNAPQQKIDRAEFENN